MPRSAILLCLLLAAWLPTGARADAILLSRAASASTIAELFIEEGAVRVSLEIGLADLPAFRDLLPDALHERLGFEPEPLAERLPRFFAEGLVVRADAGPPLPGRLLAMEPRPRLRRDEVTGEPLPAVEGEEPEVVIAVRLEYPFAGRPAAIGFEPPRASGAPTASLGFVAYHRGLPVNDFRYLPAQAVVTLDWDDPWYSRFASRNLRRRYDAPLNAFLYVEPYEVRVEIIARPRDLQHWVDLGLDGGETIPVALQPELERRAADFLAEHLGLRIDDEPVTPTLDRVHFLRRTLRTSTVITPREELDAISATLGVIFSVPTKEPLPRQASITWDLFSERIQRVPGAATDEAGPLPTILMPDDPVLVWQNFLKNPTLPELLDVRAPPSVPPVLLAAAGWGAGLGLLAVILHVVRTRRRGGRVARRAGWLAGALLLAAVAFQAAARVSDVDDERAEQILGALLHNVYRAFDFREEGQIYDVLARSVSGELLQQTYLETRRGLVLESQGGARTKVKEVALVSVDAEPLAAGVGFRARCTWNALGSVGHWGHVHQRTNQYEAELRVEPVDGAWKITGLELIQEQRI